MSDAAHKTAAARLLTQAGLSSDGLELERIHGGANNRVYAVRAAGRRAVLKAYFRGRWRLDAEFSFLEFARRCGVEAVPEPLARDDASKTALYSFVDGRRMTAADVTPVAVGRAASLFATLNRHRDNGLAAGLPRAVEACATPAEHLQRVAGRVQRLLALDPRDEVDELALRFLRERLEPAWGEARDRVLSGGDALRERAEQCVSPSDLGFHNALLQEHGEIVFLDFEYAGWDDPAKLACDFFCQVAVPVPLRELALFLETALEPFGAPDRIARRVELLLPLYRVKWVCIVLNDFLPAGRAQRDWALGGDRRSVQLEKAVSLLA